ncbi:MAG: hypothetical protein E7246_04455 [Lachnoclostridium sp.]|nr:hypothetical protein [Lachnoclostridium sp.]
MAGNEKRRKVRGTTAALDTMHILIGIVIVLLAAVSFLNPEEYMFFFPVIFLLAAILNLVTGNHKLRRSKRNQRQKITAVGQMIFGSLLFVLAVVSAISIWWR